MGHFTVLPAELQIEIFDHLQPVDIKAARAVSRKLRDNATPALFRSIVACPRYLALGAFQNISLHSIYSGYPKEIVFDGTLYSDRIAKHDQQYYYLASKYTGLQTEVGSHWARRTRWKRFAELYKEQQTMKDDGVLLQSLARGLENMQNISSIVYSPRQHPIPVERKALSDLLPRGEVRKMTDAVSRFTSPDHPFRQLIGAIFLTGYTGIQQLTVQAPKQDEEDVHFYPNVFSLAMFTFPDPNDLCAGQHLFLHLTRVDISLYIGMTVVTDNVPAARQQQLENFAKLLETAKELRHLSLGVLDMHYSVFAVRQVLFDYIGLGAIWPRLRSLSLEGISANMEDIKKSVTRHNSTLRALHLSDCILCTGSWQDIVNEVVSNASSISTFTLHKVNEGFSTYSDNGERHFVDTNPE
ncbi:F-box multi-domain protein [Pyrenophora tritici-repentis]|nr:F-box multi-domain protein [Pyrenophora tritici-repentis]KAF7453831.1 F-box multi-domain protein [Pyrenophora tritici-repentis]KAG9387592.1 F-box multi-domain protein [Pyrenophora tritici-repentis]KAI1674937.1 F-box [Pyrenophora tritici-repentis]KAI1687927.1 F-box [Pyrenophora tritici-repentis]